MTLNMYVRMAVAVIRSNVRTDLEKSTITRTLFVLRKVFTSGIAELRHMLHKTYLHGVYANRVHIFTYGLKVKRYLITMIANIHEKYERPKIPMFKFELFKDE